LEFKERPKCVAWLESVYGRTPAYGGGQPSAPVGSAVDGKVSGCKRLHTTLLPTAEADRAQTNADFRRDFKTSELLF